MSNEALGRLGTIDSANWLIDEIFRPIRHTEVALSVIGAFLAGKVIFFSVRHISRGIRLFIYHQHFSKMLRLTNSYGPWAVVTGIGDGLGVEFARQLAANGVNLIITGENEEQLKQLAHSLKNAFGVQVKPFILNLGLDSVSVNMLQNEIKNRNVGILVNNNAFNAVPNERFEELDIPEIGSRMQRNTINNAVMTHVVLSQMLAVGRGGIINIAPSFPYGISGAAQYIAEIEFIKKFSEDLAKDYSSRGIDVLTLTPFDINFNLGHYAYRYCNQAFFVPTPYLYVRSAFRMLGHTDSTTGYWAHGLQYLFCRIFPQRLWIPTKEILQTIVWRQGRPKPPLMTCSPYH